jgi:hypothetical protein
MYVIQTYEIAKENSRKRIAWRKAEIRKARGLHADRLWLPPSREYSATA